MCPHPRAHTRARHTCPSYRHVYCAHTQMETVCVNATGTAHACTRMHICIVHTWINSHLLQGVDHKREKRNTNREKSKIQEHAKSCLLPADGRGSVAEGWPMNQVLLLAVRPQTRGRAPTVGRTPDLQVHRATLSHGPEQNQRVLDPHKGRSPQRPDRWWWWCAYCAPGAVLGAGNTAVNQLNVGSAPTMWQTLG